MTTDEVKQSKGAPDDPFADVGDKPGEFEVSSIMKSFDEPVPADHDDSSDDDSSDSDDLGDSEDNLADAGAVEDVAAAEGHRTLAGQAAQADYQTVPFDSAVDVDLVEDVAADAADLDISQSNPLIDMSAPGETVTLGGADLEDPTPDIEVPASQPILEMRQIAGLTAGSMMKLSLGRAFEFNESNAGGSFSLRVLESGEAVVHPGTAKALVDEIEVTEPTLIGNAILNVASACFSVRAPRPAATSETRMESINATFASAPAIPVPPLGPEKSLSPDRLAGSRLGTLLNRNPLTRGAVGQDAWDFLQSVRETRSVVAERHRRMHPDPEELKTRLSRLDPGLWERGLDHTLFGRFSVAYATIPWEPRFDNPELIPEILHEPIVEMSLLPWVPVTANLLFGPLAIVGRRAARLAACRHAILSLAALSVPGDVRFSIRSSRNTSTSWNWCRALPPSMAADSKTGYEVLVVDGMDSYEATAPDSVANSPSDEVNTIFDDGVDTLEAVHDVRPTSGMILLAESIDEIDHPCGTILQIEPDGTGAITNHLNETIQVTPIGATEAYAHDMATRVADILTDSFL